MPRPTTLNISEALRSLGIKGADLPMFSDGVMIPTVQVADFSRTLTAESVESRGLGITVVTPLGANFYANFEIIPVGGGGLVIEDLRLTSLQVSGTPLDPAVPEGDWIVNLRSPEEGRILPTGGVSNTPVQDVGGIPTRAIVRTFSKVDTDPVVGPSFPGNFQMNPTERWFIQPGHQLVLSVNSVDDGTPPDPKSHIVITWREISRGQGAP